VDKCLKESLNKVPSHWKKQSKIYGEACEFWISDNYSCPVCEHGALLKLKANMKSIDHECLKCGELFQVKASKNSFLKRDGSIGFLGAEYKTTVGSINNENKWNLILVEYDKNNSEINRVGVILKNDIAKENVIPRNPLGPNARRAGWQGCNFKFDYNVVSFSS
tara:strand:- start:5765 stop:6256 length:492 start_codon:yes stop_codon:yes gene_type:complete